MTLYDVCLKNEIGLNNMNTRNTCAQNTYV